MTREGRRRPIRARPRISTPGGPWAPIRAGLMAGILLLALLGSAVPVAAADPSASPGSAGDVRTNPAAPGLVGDPLFAVVGVAAIGLASVVVTLAALRLTDRS